MAKFRFSRRAEADLLSIGEYTLRKCVVGILNWKNHDSYQEAFQRLISDLKASDTALKVTLDVRSNMHYTVVHEN